MPDIVIQALEELLRKMHTVFLRDLLSWIARGQVKNLDSPFYKVASIVADM
jgi:hypothetical protein